tara:strand:+ start:2622 stop:2951 length:330 start_codon:yes stop_codon:yes gene_type:complete
MDLNEYQRKARETALYPNVGNNPIYPTLGLCGEAGEVAEKVKKIIRDKAGLFDSDSKETIKYELGDVLWYVAQLTSEMGFELTEIAEANLSKLSSRARRGKLTGEGDNR